MIKYILVDSYTVNFEEYDHKPTSDDLNEYVKNTGTVIEELKVYEVSNAFAVKHTFSISAEKIKS